MNIFIGLSGPKVIFEADSKYNGHIRVTEFGDIRRVMVDNIVQSLSTNAKSCSRLYWGKIVEILKDNHPNPKSVLILGLGGGTLAHLISQNFPGVSIKSIEIDKTMVDIARQFFNVDQIPNHTIQIGDALRSVAEPEKLGLAENMFDVLIVDIYVGEKYPDLGKSGNFLAGIKKLIIPGGLVIFNRIYKEEHQDEVNIFIDYVSSFFQDVKNLVVAGYTNSDNVLIYCKN